MKNQQYQCNSGLITLFSMFVIHIHTVSYMDSILLLNVSAVWEKDKVTDRGSDRRTEGRTAQDNNSEPKFFFESAGMICIPY